MIWAAAFKLLKAIPLRAWLAMGLVALLVVAVAALRSHWIGVGEAPVMAQWEAEKAAILDAAYAKGQADEAAANQARSEMLARLGWVLPEIDRSRYVYVDRIRTIYRDQPIPVGCERPADVRRVFSEAIASANRAAEN